MKKFGSGDGPFVTPQGDVVPGAPEELERPTNQYFNSVYAENKQLIETSGQALTPADQDENLDPQQTAKAAFIYSAASGFFNASTSTANSKVLTKQGNFAIPSASLLQGAIFEFYNLLPNTGPVTCTISAAGIPSAPVVDQSGNPLASGALQTGIVRVQYDHQNGRFLSLVFADYVTGSIEQNKTQAWQVQAAKNISKVETGAVITVGSGLTHNGWPMATPADAVAYARYAGAFTVAGFVFQFQEGASDISAVNFDGLPPNIIFRGDESNPADFVWTSNAVTGVGSGANHFFGQLILLGLTVNSSNGDGWASQGNAIMYSRNCTFNSFATNGYGISATDSAIQTNANCIGNGAGSYAAIIASDSSSQTNLFCTGNGFHGIYVNGSASQTNINCTGTGSGGGSGIVAIYSASQTNINCTPIAGATGYRLFVGGTAKLGWFSGSPVSASDANMPVGIGGKNQSLNVPNAVGGVIFTF